MNFLKGSLVCASAKGATIDLSEYTVSDTAGWTVESDGYGSTNLITGSVKSTTSGKGVLRIDYNEIEQGRSEDELAFAELDLGIAEIGKSRFGGRSIERWGHGEPAA